MDSRVPNRDSDYVPGSPKCLDSWDLALRTIFSCQAITYQIY